MIRVRNLRILREASDLASALHRSWWRLIMKSTLFFLATGAIVVGLTAFGQETNQSDPQTQGRGRGGAPYAWGDSERRRHLRPHRKPRRSGAGPDDVSRLARSAGAGHGTRNGARYGARHVLPTRAERPPDGSVCSAWPQPGEVAPEHRGSAAPHLPPGQRSLRGPFLGPIALESKI